MRPSTHFDSSSRANFVRLAVTAMAAALAGLASCSNVEKAPPKPRSAAVNATIMESIPEILRGTVMAVGYLDGYNGDIVATGYGLVVGLRGTGHRIMPAEIRAHMLGEMARLGVGSAASGFDMKPEELLDSYDTAVVVVQALIPPGAVKGAKFDVRVASLPGTETSSLEGGRLWTAQLRPAIGPGLPPVGSKQARMIAVARGEVFTNPFIIGSEGESSGVSEGGLTGLETAVGTSIDLRTGHVLGGGTTVREMPLKIRLFSPSHNVAASLQQVINSYFPQEPGQRYPTGHAINDEAVSITVPPSWAHRTRDFVEVLMHLTMWVPAVEPVVAKINADLRRSPGDSIHAAWRWQALGPGALPGVKQFYNYPEEKPRLAALQTGAKLNDALVVPPLLSLAANEGHSVRTRQEAIGLLGGMSAEPRIVFGLRDLLNDKEQDVRIAAYESLAKLGTRLVRSVPVDGRFVIDFVDSSEPLIYVTLLERPRIVVFGPTEIARPVTLSTWGDRLTILGDSGDEKLRVRYLDEFGRRYEYAVSAQPEEFIPFLGHTTTIERPQPGLGLTYSETVGVLWSIFRAGYLNAAVRTESDRILLKILDQDRDPASTEARPEFNRLLEETAPAEESELLPVESSRGSAPTIERDMRGYP